MKNQTVEIQLLGQKITLKTAAEDPALVKEVVELVTARLKDSEKKIKAGAPHYVALAALFDVAAEYVQAKRRATGHQKSMNEKSRQLLTLIDAELK